jgi:C4-dicarboxylate-specific signal transduction histidine kinase
VIVFAGATGLAYALHLRAAGAGFMYLVVVVVLSLLDSAVSSIVFSVAAVLALNYFFLEPRFTFGIDSISDVVTLVCFLITSLIVVGLVREVRHLGVQNQQQGRTLDLARRLEQAQAELAHVSRVTTLGELSASIAHEVNQPLTAIVTHGDAALRFLHFDPPQTEEVEDALQRMIADGRRAGDIIRRIRALTRKSEAQIAAIDLNEVVREAAPLIARALTDGGAELRLHLAPGELVIQGDRVQLQQVVINLAVNGIQAMAGRPQKLLTIGSAMVDGHARVTVQDTGPGIDPAHVKTLFDPFFTTKAEGMGMGLSICRTILEAHNGRIWAEAAVTQGALFTLEVPLQGGSAA